MTESEFLSKCEDLWDWNNVPMASGVKGELMHFYQAIWDRAYSDGYNNGYDTAHSEYGSRECDHE